MASRTPVKGQQEGKVIWSAREHQKWIQSNHDPSFDKFDVAKLASGEVATCLLFDALSPALLSLCVQ